MLSAEQYLREYSYWAEQAREIAETPGLGYGSESYRAAAAMEYRALGRFDVLNELAVSR